MNDQVSAYHAVGFTGQSTRVEDCMTLLAINTS
jgi:hypothetical protein